MKRSVLLTVGLFVVTSVLGIAYLTAQQKSEEESDLRFRTWTDSTGTRQVEAALVGMKEGKVQLRKKDGNLASVAIERLSQVDQAYVQQELAQGKASTPSTASTTPSQTSKSATATPASWSRFRGPNGLGKSDDKGLPTEWSPEKNIVWKTELPGPGASAPIVLGDKVFLTTHTGYGLKSDGPGNMDDLRRQVLCMNRADGEIVWTTEVETKLPEQPYEKRMQANGYASSTPVVDDERVYAFFGKSGVFALDHQGKQLWQADVGSSFHGWGSAASPILYKDLLIVNASIESQSLVALNKKTGKEVWRAEGIREAWNTPVVVDLPDGKTELVVGMAKMLLGFDPDTGEQLWSCKTIGWYIVPGVIAHDGVLYHTGGRSQECFAIRAGGRGDVTDTHILWKTNKGTNVPTPIYHDGHLYFASDSLGIAYCLEAATGKVVYEERLNPRPGTIYASPVMVDGKIYYLGQYGRTLVVAAKPEFELLSVNELGPDKFFNSPPTVDQGQLLMRSDHYLYCIDEK